MITALVEIYYSGRLNRPLITFQQAGRKWSRAAVLVTALGASLYQTADLGIAPYDYLSLGLRDYTPCPYFGCRIFTNALSALLCWLAGWPCGPWHLDLCVLPWALHPVLRSDVLPEGAAIQTEQLRNPAASNHTLRGSFLFIRKTTS